MAWRNAGTVTVTNNSVTVTGVGTGFDTVGDTGQSFLGPDGLPIEIASVDSVTQITLASPYRGATAAGASYRIMPVVGGQNLRSLAIAANELLRTFGSVRDGIGQGIFPSGSVGTPGFRFSGDEDTGFYRAGANILGVVTGGVERARFDSTGITFPAAAAGYGSGRLNAGGPGGVSGWFGSYDGAGVRRAYLGYWDGSVVFGAVAENGAPLAFAAGNAERMRIDPTTGNIGINTNSPSQKLHVAGAVLSNNLILQGDGTNAYVRAQNAGGALYLGVNGNNVWQLSSLGNISPSDDNAYSIGIAGKRISVLFAGTGTINTSDERDKLWHGFADELKAKYRRIAKAIMDELGFFQFLKQIEEKGEDGARWHFGARAQAVWGFVAAEGLCASLVGEGPEQRPDPAWTDPPPPAFLCWNIWEDEYQPIMEEQQVGSETVIIRHEATGLLDAAGQPIMRYITEDRPIMGMVEVGQKLEQAAGNRFGLRVDQMGLLLDWELRQQAKDHQAAIAELHARVETLEAA